MFKLQEQLEVHISGPDWRKYRHDYRLCIHMECAEIIDHMGWKHWKDVNAEPNWDMIAMELVDVWHFALAHFLMHRMTAKVLYDDLIEAQSECTNPKVNMVQACVGMGYSMFMNDLFPLGNFAIACDLAGMDFDQLYVLYISKNVLNRFRQDHGYKEGMYMKSWAGKEDNEHLMELCKELKDELTADKLYFQLALRYKLAGH